MNYRQDIEIIRIISAFAIIWFHSGAQGSEISYAGLVVFLVVSIYLASRSSLFGKMYLVGIGKRLLVPWIFWLMIYGILNLLMGRTIVPLERGFIFGVLTGSSVHLWFVPFLFICLAIYSFIKIYVSEKVMAIFSASLVVIVLVSTPIWRLKSIEFGAPLAQYFHALPGFFLGVYFANANALQVKYNLLLLALMAIAEISVIHLLGVTYLVGMLVCCFLLMKISANFKLLWLDSISKCMFGVYFLHVLVLNMFKKINIIYGIWLPVAVFFVSLYVVYFNRKSFPRFSRYWS
jgi:surface polysaccharide O-acyltransferase-like enzyme